MGPHDRERRVKAGWGASWMASEIKAQDANEGGGASLSFFLYMRGTLPWIFGKEELLIVLVQIIFNVCLFEGKNRMFEFVYQMANTFEFLQWLRKWWSSKFLRSNSAHLGMFNVCLFEAKYKVFEFDSLNMNKLQSILCLKNDVQIHSIFNEKVFNSPLAW